MREKVCTKCKQVKLLEEFHKDAIQHDGYCKKCKECATRIARLYYSDNKGKVAEYHKQYRLENKEKIAKRQRRYQLKNKERMSEHDKRWRAKHKVKRAADSRARNLLRNFSMTVEDYDRMLVKQRGCCKICGRMPKKARLAVDHDHESGKVRGLLCSNCNLILGNAKDCPTVLRLAALYVEEHNSGGE